MLMMASKTLRHESNGHVSETLETRVRNVATLEQARSEFASMKESAKATGKAAQVHAFWQPAQALGGNRAPPGLKAAIKRGEFFALVNHP